MTGGLIGYGTGMTAPRALVSGLAAGAAGTAVLNAVTYLDVAVRARGSSSVPADTVQRLTDLAGVELSSEGPDSDTATNRRQGLGALLGYLTGFGLGAAFGLLRVGPLRRVPVGAAGVGLGLAAMASTDIPYTALGVSDPRTWGPKGWAADLVPHVCYGLATAAVFDALSPGRTPTGR